jgi:putative transposase
MRDRSRRLRKSMRLSGWDYCEDGAYFVTICTHNRRSILDDPRIAQALLREWSRAICGGRQPERGDFVVMPNHVHGVVWISRLARAAATARHFGDHTSTVPIATTNEAKSYGSKGASPLRMAGCMPGSLSAKVGAFKSAACKRLTGRAGLAKWLPRHGYS